MVIARLRLPSPSTQNTCVGVFVLANASQLCPGPLLVLYFLCVYYFHVMIIQGIQTLRESQSLEYFCRFLSFLLCLVSTASKETRRRRNPINYDSFLLKKLLEYPKRESRRKRRRKSVTTTTITKSRRIHFLLFLFRNRND